MEHTTLGRSGLKVSVGGLGCGGPSRLGMRDNKSEKDCVALVRQAMDLGVNFLDTAESYGTEVIVGKAISAVPREKIVLSTKKAFPLEDSGDPAGEVRRSLEQSLRLLQSDYIDVYHVHGVEPEDYSSAVDRLVPTLFQLREEGKIRFLGITEAFVPDPGHEMLQRALRDDFWDVVMVGFNILNPSARARVFPKTLEKRVGTLVMFAVRRGLSQPARLKEIWADLKERRLVDPSLCDVREPLDFLIREGIAVTLPDAAYRFCRHELGVQVVLTGTGDLEHLRANVDSILKPPLPEAALQRLRDLFGRLDCLTGN